MFLFEGEGRYGKVFHALFKGTEVAVKEFTSLQNEKSWTHEKEIYTMLPQHENILLFKAADITSQLSVTKHLLITQYHSNGKCCNI